LQHKAQLAFTAARAEQQKIVQSLRDYGPAWCELGVIDAALGRKEEALREGRRGVDLLPVKKDSVNGVHMIVYFAMIVGWVGEKDLAFEQLATAVRLPYGGGYLSYGQLKLMPFWDPAPRRSALRKNRSLSLAERNSFQVVVRLESFF
jgi:hypothetical protein